MRIIFILFLYTSVPVLLASKIERINIYAELNTVKKRNILVNILINKLIAYIRFIITHGSPLIGIPPLDPFEVEDFHLIIPTGLFNLDFRFKNVSVKGFGGFKMYRNLLHLSNLTFELEFSIPRVIMSSEMLHLSELDNEFTTVIPIYTKDNMECELNNFRFQALLQLKRSEDQKSILIDKIEEPLFYIPSLKIDLDSVIDKDNLETFSEIEIRFVDYLNSRKDAIARAVSNAIIIFGNPILNRLETWRYIEVLL